MPAPHLPPTFRPWTQHVVDLLGVREGARCLDLPCGDGVLAAAFARAAAGRGRVVAVDTDPSAVAECQRRIATLGLTSSVETRPVLTPDDRFDIAGSLLALPHRADRADLLRRSWSALHPGGRLAAAVWADAATVPPIRHVGAAFAEVTGDTPATLRDAASLGTGQALRALAREADLPAGRDHRARDLMRFDGVSDVLTTISAAYDLTADLEALDGAQVAAMLDVLTAGLLQYTRADGTIAVPAEALILVVVRPGPPRRP